MQVSRSEEYGLRLVMRLAAEGGQLTVRELADREGLPDATVAKVVARLRRAGLVKVERGRGGGCTLSEPASGLTLARVVRACGSELLDRHFCERMSPGGGCARGGRCGLKPVWRGLTDVIGNFLSQITVADLVAGGNPITGAAARHTTLGLAPDGAR